MCSFLRSNGDDVGRELAQVTRLGRFQAKSIEVSGTRKLAAIVRRNDCNNRDLGLVEIPL